MVNTVDLIDAESTEEFVGLMKKRFEMYWFSAMDELIASHKEHNLYNFPLITLVMKIEAGMGLLPKFKRLIPYQFSRFYNKSYMVDCGIESGLKYVNNLIAADPVALYEEMKKTFYKILLELSDEDREQCQHELQYDI